MADNKRTRRDFVKAAGAATLGAALASREASALPFNASRPAREMLMYVGTYTSGRSEGIYIYKLDLADGSLERVGVARGVTNPSYLALDRARRLLYSVEETEDRKSTRLNSSHANISYAVFCLKK